MQRLAPYTDRLRSCTAILIGVLLGVCWLKQSSVLVTLSAWILWTLIILLSQSRSCRSMMRTWFLTGLAVRATAFHWVPDVVAENFDVPWSLALLFFSLMIAVESITWMILGWVTHRVFQLQTLPVWVIPSVTIILDHFWPRVFPWTMGHMLIGMPVLIQIADLTGALGLTWLMTAVSCAILKLFRPANLSASHARLQVTPESFRLRRRSLFVPAVTALMLGAVLYGTDQQSRRSSELSEGRAMTVAAIQVDSSFVAAEEQLRNLSLTLKPSPELVVWPESSLGYYCDELNSFHDENEVYELSREPHCGLPGVAISGTTLLACGVLYRNDAGPDGPYQNTALLIDDRQSIIGRHAKRTLLPFGEYVPGQSWCPWLREIANIDTLREPGDSCRPLVTSNGIRIGSMICYDDINPSNARETTEAGAELLTVQVNAADYNNPVALRQHCLLAMLRAVENRRYMIRCASTGITCIISPVGEFIAQCEPQQEGVVTATIVTSTERTIFSQFGDWFVMANLLSCLPIIVQYLRGRSYSNSGLFGFNTAQQTASMAMMMAKKNRI